MTHIAPTFTDRLHELWKFEKVPNVVRPDVFIEHSKNGRIAWHHISMATPEILKQWDEAEDALAKEAYRIVSANRAQFEVIATELIEMWEDLGLEVYKNKNNATLYAPYQKILDEMKSQVPTFIPTYKYNPIVTYTDSHGREHLLKRDSGFTATYTVWWKEIKQQVENIEFRCNQIATKMWADFRTMMESGVTFDSFPQYGDFKKFVEEVRMNDHILGTFQKDAVKHLVTNERIHVRGKVSDIYSECGNYLTVFYQTGDNAQWPDVCLTFIPLSGSSEALRRLHRVPLHPWPELSDQQKQEWTQQRDRILKEHESAIFTSLQEK